MREHVWTVNKPTWAKQAEPLEGLGAAANILGKYLHTKTNTFNS